MFHQTVIQDHPLSSVGYFGPAGLADDNAHDAECIGGATGYIDRLILGTDHIYGYPTAKDVYETGPFDPEGILGILLKCLWSFFVELSIDFQMTTPFIKKQSSFQNITNWIRLPW